MSEAKEGCAFLEDVEESTFVRFSQYAYTGDYTAADPDNILDSSMVAATSTVANDAAASQEDLRVTLPPLAPEHVAEPALVAVEPRDICWDGSGTSKKDKKRAKKAQFYSYGEMSPEDAEPETPSKKQQLWDKFKNRYYAISVPDFQPRENRESCEDYTEVFLCHARLYVFAEKYDIGPLRLLSLHKLQRTLAGFTLYNERVRDIVDLMQYSDLHTADRSGSIDGLRLLVTHYAACVIEDLVRSDKFQSLLQEAGSLAWDLIGQMLKRLD